MNWSIVFMIGMLFLLWKMFPREQNRSTIRIDLKIPAGTQSVELRSLLRDANACQHTKCYTCMTVRTMFEKDMDEIKLEFTSNPGYECNCTVCTRYAA